MVKVRPIRQTDRQLSYVNTIHVFTLKRKKPEVSKYIWREMLVKDAKKLKDKSLSKAAFKRVSHFPLKNGAWPKRWDGCHSVMKIQEIRVKSRKKRENTDYVATGKWIRTFWQRKKNRTVQGAGHHAGLGFQLVHRGPAAAPAARRRLRPAAVHPGRLSGPRLSHQDHHRRSV